MKNEIIGIVGAGAMGSGIAQVAAQAGHKVMVYDTNQDQIERASRNLHQIFEKLVSKEKFTQQEADSILRRIQWVDNLHELEDCHLVIEAIVEKLEAKRSVFEVLDSILSEDAILASNTSSLSIASISGAAKDPGRVIGIHFFNPAPLMPLVEIIPSLATRKAVVDQCVQLIDSWKKTTVLAKDTPGFIVNRVARPFYSESLKMYEEGVADIPTIDWALREVGGFRMGPFELMDLIGHDVNYVVTETVWTQFYYDPRFKPSITQKRLLEAGMLGRKSGKGFYDHSGNGANPTPDTDFVRGEEIVDRVLYMLINEAADALFMGIGTARDIDMAMTKGVNYPKGLLQWADEKGIENVVKYLDDLFDEFRDDRYRCCPLLRRMARSGKTFF
mgnify:CR=1 FL=1